VGICERGTFSDVTELLCAEFGAAVGFHDVLCGGRLVFGGYDEVPAEMPLIIEPGRCGKRFDGAERDK
jgi:hypothetical protein